MFKQFLSLALVLTAAAAVAADVDLVIPAAGTGPGGFGSRWATEVTLHNAGNDPITVHLRFHASNGEAGSHSVTLPGKSTQSLDDIVASAFGFTDSITGAITIDTEDVAAGKLAVTSRTYNVSEDGEFGQDIPAMQTSQALFAGDTGVINGPSNAEDNRFNFGVYALEKTTIQWRLLRRDGSLAATVDQTYQAGVQFQYSAAVAAFFNQTPESNDVVHAVLSSGRAFVYGSMVNNRTGDPTFIPAARTRENLPVLFLGVDLDEDGDLDIVDADRDGNLDAPVPVHTALFPSYFRVQARDPEGKSISFTLANSPGDARLIDDNGTIQVGDAGERGTTEILIVLVSDGLDVTELRIPLRYQ